VFNGSEPPTRHVYACRSVSCTVRINEGEIRTLTTIQRPAMVGLDPIVRVLLGVVERGRDQLIDHSP
jgi:hypothetical protein